MSPMILTWQQMATKFNRIYKLCFELVNPPSGSRRNMPTNESIFHDWRDLQNQLTVLHQIIGEQYIHMPTRSHVQAVVNDGSLRAIAKNVAVTLANFTKSLRTKKCESTFTESMILEASNAAEKWNSLICFLHDPSSLPYPYSTDAILRSATSLSLMGGLDRRFVKDAVSRFEKIKGRFGNDYRKGFEDLRNDYMVFQIIKDTGSLDVDKVARAAVMLSLITGANNKLLEKKTPENLMAIAIWAVANRFPMLSVGAQVEALAMSFILEILVQARRTLYQVTQGYQKVGDFPDIIPLVKNDFSSGYND
ncbi:hypothetical protein C8Q75DRAFT_807463 [Abortiporus biennis]|nr:hypothetical protein C8Q75DRAFT_807463 [Abortiporus biennis]